MCIRDRGGTTIQSFAYAMWEQLLGFSMIVGLFGIFKKKFNKQGEIVKKLSESAYGVYVIHTPVIIGLSALFLNFEIPQLLKFVMLAPLALIACFAVAMILKQIPGIKQVL
jgi:surface polysaccharide O-acyltransferase-like enzyme